MPSIEDDPKTLICGHNGQDDRNMSMRRRVLRGFFFPKDYRTKRRQGEVHRGKVRQFAMQIETQTQTGFVTISSARASSHKSRSFYYGNQFGSECQLIQQDGRSETLS